MKTRARLVLEKRFRQMANGKTLAAFSAAALLGLRLMSQSAEAAFVNPCAYGGETGPTVDVFVNDQFVERLHLAPGAVDSQGKQYIDLTSGGGGRRAHTPLPWGAVPVFPLTPRSPGTPPGCLAPG